MKIMVTGGAGYIGSTTADHLLKNGHEVLIVDNLSHGFIQAIPSGCKFIETDIANEEIMLPILAQVDAVMHFAASIEAGESMKFPGKFFENNSVKTQKLIDLAIKARVGYFVFSSTAAVYQSKSEPIDETSVLMPENVYGESKKISEDMLRWYARTTNLKAGVLRYFNAAGASLLNNPPVRGGGLQGATHIIPNILQVPLGMSDSFKIFGSDYTTKDGTCIRDYIHVDDLARAHLLLLDALVANKFTFDVFNLGNGNGYSVKEVLDVARQVTGEDIKSMTEERRIGDAPVLIANSTKAQNILDWQPQHPELETIVGSAWEWHRNNPHGYGE
jgi:UDP-glucose 4-epimerase